MASAELPIGPLAAELAARADRQVEALVGISSRSGDVAGAEEALALSIALLPSSAVVERLPCSTAGNAPDLLARIPGTGSRRAVLVGHVDTVIARQPEMPLRREPERLYGPGTTDMKGGVVLAIGVASALAEHPELFAELSVLIVTDEEWRKTPFGHRQRLAGYDACLCFEAGEKTPDGHEGVVVRRKAAGTLGIRATGRAAHSGSAPDNGLNALLALSRTAVRLAGHHDPRGPDRLSVVPTVLRSGEALNMVPPSGELICDMRADQLDAFEAVLSDVPAELDGVVLEATIERRWPGMDARQATAPLLERAGARIGRPIIGVSRGGASDASHFAADIPLTIDGLGPRGGGAHTPDEFLFLPSLSQRAEVALAVTLEALS